MAMRRLSNMAGLILAAIEAGGWSCNGRQYRCGRRDKQEMRIRCANLKQIAAARGSDAITLDSRWDRQSQAGCDLPSIIA
jgi:hypothetical protein